MKTCLSLFLSFYLVFRWNWWSRVSVTSCSEAWWPPPLRCSPSPFVCLSVWTCPVWALCVRWSWWKWRWGSLTHGSTSFSSSQQCKRSASQGCSSSWCVWLRGRTNRWATTLFSQRKSLSLVSPCNSNMIWLCFSNRDSYLPNTSATSPQLARPRNLRSLISDWRKSRT